LEGIPLRLRSLLLNFGRPGFNMTPTGCEPKSIDATLTGDEQAVARPGAYYQVANCGSLPFSPQLGLNLSGGVRRRGHPAFHAVLKMKPGEANLRRVSVTLPRGELLDNAHIGTVCTAGDFAMRACPAGSLIGHAEARTPLLDQPLAGPVYLRSSNHRLPDLVFDLRGQIDLQVVGRVDSVDESLRTTFESLPDAPVDSFVLDLLGGKKGLVNNSESLCGSRKKAVVRLTGQNESALTKKVRLHARCGSKASHRRHLRLFESREVR
jgi:hypothetical protein